MLSKIWQYELLDEMMDFGYPQFTEATILSEFIKTDAYRLEVTQRPPMAVTNAVSWRNEGIFYKKNEVCTSSESVIIDNVISLMLTLQCSACLLLLSGFLRCG